MPPSPTTARRIAVIGTPGAWSTEQLADAVAERTGSRILVDIERVGFDLAAGTATHDGADLLSMDAIIVKKLGRTYSPVVLERIEMLRHLEASGVRVFSRPDPIHRAVDRLSCTLTLRRGGIPLPDTFITEDPQAAFDAVGRFGKAVLKPLYTSKARGMELAEAGNGTASVIERFRADGNSIIYVQKFVESPGRDLGIVFLGGEYLASYARVSKEGSWNTTTRCGGRYAPADPGPELIALARRAQDLFGLEFTCVDVVETCAGPKVFEVSAFGGFRGLSEACGLDAAALYADHVVRRLGAAS